jgi:hypothetical protein
MISRHKLYFFTSTLRLVRKYFENKGAYVSPYSDPLLALQDFMKK